MRIFTIENIKKNFIFITQLIIYLAILPFFISYNANDVSLNHFYLNNDSNYLLIKNHYGKLGAIISDFLMQVFGKVMLIFLLVKILCIFLKYFNFNRFSSKVINYILQACLLLALLISYDYLNLNIFHNEHNGLLGRLMNNLIPIDDLIVFIGSLLIIITFFPLTFKVGARRIVYYKKLISKPYKLLFGNQDNVQEDQVHNAKYNQQLIAKNFIHQPQITVNIIHKHDEDHQEQKIIQESAEERIVPNNNEEKIIYNAEMENEKLENQNLEPKILYNPHNQKCPSVDHNSQYLRNQEYSFGNSNKKLNNYFLRYKNIINTIFYSISQRILTNNNDYLVKKEETNINQDFDKINNHDTDYQVSHLNLENDNNIENIDSENIANNSSSNANGSVFSNDKDDANYDSINQDKQQESITNIDNIDDKLGSLENHEHEEVNYSTTTKLNVENDVDALNQQSIENKIEDDDSIDANLCDVDIIHNNCSNVDNYSEDNINDELINNDQENIDLNMEESIEINENEENPVTPNNTDILANVEDFPENIEANNANKIIYNETLHEDREEFLRNQKFEQEILESVIDCQDSQAKEMSEDEQELAEIEEFLSKCDDSTVNDNAHDSNDGESNISTNKNDINYISDIQTCNSSSNSEIFNNIEDTKEEHLAINNNNECAEDIESEDQDLFEDHRQNIDEEESDFGIIAQEDNNDHLSAHNNENDCERHDEDNAYNQYDDENIELSQHNIEEQYENENAGHNNSENIEQDDKYSSMQNNISEKHAEKNCTNNVIENSDDCSMIHKSNNNDYYCNIEFLALDDTQSCFLQERSILEEKGKELLTVLNDFGVHGKIIDIYPGPVVTLFEFQPIAGIKSSKVIALAEDIARSLCATSARISIIHGKNALGIEIPNAKRNMVFLRELLEFINEQENKNILLPIALGKKIDGSIQIVDLTKMPHLLIAGTTGSGKSVAINTMILSLLYKLPPEKCRLIMIDPKMLELSIYNDIPHLLTPVITDPKKAIIALKWIVNEMEERYQMMTNLNVRNINGFNEKIANAKLNNQTLTIQKSFEQEGQVVKRDVEVDTIPFIVVIVDEMADLMIVAGKEIEILIQRLAQMARAAGIHIIMATQRPSVDVITGVIKANFPTRISFSVTSKIDSRTILGEQGAEQLLGMGDMLYMQNGGKIMRLHGAFVADEEVQKIVENLKNDFGSADYIQSIEHVISNESTSFLERDFDNSGNDDEDNLFRQALDIVLEDKRVSISYIQRKLRIGYNRAANLVERMEKEQIVSPPDHSGKRTIN